MKKILFLVSLICLSGLNALAENYKVGDWIEYKGPTSGMWFDGEVKQVENNKYTILTWGWMDDPITVEASQLVPYFENTEIAIRRGGSVWAVVSTDGSVRINGSIVGSIDPDDGTVRVSGSIVGKIQFNGVLFKGGSEIGAVWPSNELYNNGMIIGEIDNRDGTIRKSGSIWGGIDSFSFKFREFRMAAAVLAFFSTDFGY